MKILDLHSKKVRNVKNLKRNKHKEYDKNGKLKTRHYIEFTIIGKNREWRDYMYVDDFKKLNPKVSIK